MGGHHVTIHYTQEGSILNETWKIYEQDWSHQHATKTFLSKLKTHLIHLDFSSTWISIIQMEACQNTIRILILFSVKFSWECLAGTLLTCGPGSSYSRTRTQDRKHNRSGQTSDPLKIGQLFLKHRKNCECCPVSQLIVR